MEDSSLPKPFPEPLLAYLDAANTNPQDAEDFYTYVVGRLDQIKAAENNHL